jgi:hypothetical protein
MRCTHCGATVPDDAERCRKCLRRSGLTASPPLTPDAAQPSASPDVPHSALRGLRAILVFGALLVVVAIVLIAFRIFFLPD